MREQVTEAITSALVDEFGLEKTLRILDRAREKDAEQHPSNRNPDLIGMKGFAKSYAEGHREDTCGMCEDFSSSDPRKLIEHLRRCRGKKKNEGRV